MSGISEERKLYLKRYYEQNKHKWKKARQTKSQVGLHKHTDQVENYDEQLNMFDYVEELNNVKHSTTFKIVEPIYCVKEELNNGFKPTSSVQHSTEFKKVKQLNTVKQAPRQVEHYSTPDQPVHLIQAVDDVAATIHQLALSRLFPSAKRKLNPWAIAELLALILLSTLIVFFTTKAVAAVDASLWHLVALLEVVSIFFSLTLVQHSGASFVARGVLLITIVGLTNFLVAKATLTAGQAQIREARAAEAKTLLLNDEIELERLRIENLEARGRVTAAGEKTKRLDLLRVELESLRQGQVAAVDQVTVWLTVVIRVLLGFSVILINGQISKIVISKNFFRTTLGS